MTKIGDILKDLYKVSAFTKGDEGGNKAGVYLNADTLTDDQMQKIAKDLGYSETAFVFKSDVADFKVRFFTPFMEVDLCGHATLATFFVLKTLNKISIGTYTQETKAGILKIRSELDLIYLELKAPLFYDMIDIKSIDACFSSISYHENLKPCIVSTGLKEIFVPVKNKHILDQLIPNFEKIKEISAIYDVIGIHVFALDDDIDAYGRNFAPIVGIDEESATGTSNGALACYLNKLYQDKSHYILRQGYSMELPSQIHVDIFKDHQEITAVWVGGNSKLL